MEETRKISPFTHLKLNTISYFMNADMGRVLMCAHLPADLDADVVEDALQKPLMQLREAYLHGMGDPLLEVLDRAINVLKSLNL